MSSPFSSWTRSSTPSQASQDVADGPFPAAQNLSRSVPRNGLADPRVLSSSFHSAPRRKRTRSFVKTAPGDSFGKLLSDEPRWPFGRPGQPLNLQAFKAPVDSAQNARSVRNDTADLATYQLSDGKLGQPPPLLPRPRSRSTRDGRDAASSWGDDTRAASPSSERTSGPAVEVSGPSPQTEFPESPRPSKPHQGPSILSSMLRSVSPRTAHPAPPPQLRQSGPSTPERRGEDSHTPEFHAFERLPSPVDDYAEDEEAGHSEVTPLLRQTSRQTPHANGFGTDTSRNVDLEGQKSRFSKPWFSSRAGLREQARSRFLNMAKAVGNPKLWDRRALWRNVVVAPVACLPAVIVGLLLNILDALSYGMILFPLGSPIFSNLGSAGISIFYVSTIVSQLVFSFGSVFKGGIGSELIEVVPFFHRMAATITGLVGEDNPDAVIATTITSYILSAMLTGAVFYSMGKFKFGYIIGFIPRHILIGCIGGVGWFLVATGFEVTARMSGSITYDLATLRLLFQPDTIPLWVLPLALAVVLFYGQFKITSKYFLPLYIIAIPIVFYFFVLSLEPLKVDRLRDGGWIFTGPPPSEPWWYFYTLFKFNLVRWDAIAQCIPAMFALTFFGILHVPINVPALALNTGEDHADLDYELKLHGYSNFLSGLCGSIQNYLVYANTVFFMRSGGDSRLAGIELAILTFCVMIIGPSLVGFIPVTMVGVLIFDLGFELLHEAVWQTRKKLKFLEYLTVLVIVLIMGIYDFVVGIGVGILLAFASLIFQASRVSAIRSSHSGDVVRSTVRRNPTQQHYLQQVGRQIFVVKLAGYLFFGTIVGVEEKIRALISDDAFHDQPIRFLLLDMCQVTGVDYSSGEAFNTINRLLDSKGIRLVLSGVEAESELGQSLRAVGLGQDGIEVLLLPDLNSALECCENELLKTFYASLDAGAHRPPALTSLEVPRRGGSPQSLDVFGSSPRRRYLHEAAKKTLSQVESTRSSRWQGFKEPLRLMLQIFRDLSDKNEDFWFRAVSYFKRAEYAAGTTLFRRGETAKAFYLIESGILRAEYDLPQGWLCESIVAGTTCGELPFFSETDRTATTVTERDCVVWMMDEEGWAKLQKDEPDVAQELLRISLKLTTERMSVITSYVLTMAS